MVCIYSVKEYFCQEACTLWHSVSELCLPAGCVSRHERIQIVTSTQLLRVHLFRPLYYSASADHFHSQAVIIIIIIIIIIIVVVVVLFKDFFWTALNYIIIF